MHYVTHALSPMLALTGSVVTTVRAMGSGRLEPHQTTGGFDNPFASEVGLFALDQPDVVAEITMSFFRVARSYIEGFSLYGDTMGLEWPDGPDGPLTAFRLRPDDGGRGPAGRRDGAGRPARSPTGCPNRLRRYTERTGSRRPTDRPDCWRPAEHGGSHPHLVHEFVSAISESRPSAVDAPVAAAWTAPGVVAHQSALAGGAPMDVPRYA